MKCPDAQFIIVCCRSEHQGVSGQRQILYFIFGIHTEKLYRRDWLDLLFAIFSMYILPPYQVQPHKLYSFTVLKWWSAHALGTACVHPILPGFCTFLSCVLQIILVRAECVRCPWAFLRNEVSTIFGIIFLLIFSVPHSFLPEGDVLGLWNFDCSFKQPKSKIFFVWGGLF